MLTEYSISEVSPPSERGMLMSGYQTALQLSALAGFWGAFATNAIFPDSSPLQWQIPVAIQLVPGILLLLGTLVIPETPRYLAEKGKYGKAEESLAWLRGLEHGDAALAIELDEIREAAELGASRALMGKNQSFWRESLKKGVRRRLGVGVGLMIAQNMVGLNALNYCMQTRNSFPSPLTNTFSSRRPRNLHVRRLYLCLLLPLPNRPLRPREAHLRHRLHVRLRQAPRQPLLAETRLPGLRHLDAGPRVLCPYPTAARFDA
jgi:MFS family permease